MYPTVTSGNFSYELPYQVYPFFQIEDMRTYIGVCVYLVIAVPMIVSSFAGPDAFVLSMALHVCGQFAALSCKVENLLKDNVNYRRYVREIILKHYELIELSSYSAIYIFYEINNFAAFSA